jgi:1-phosphofructokinase family hexose kinase
LIKETKSFNSSSLIYNISMNAIYTITLNPAIDRELTVPNIDYDQVLRSSGQHTDLGGKGFNVSRMLRSLGVESTALGFVGGKSGEFLVEGLQSLGINTDFVWISGETRTNFSLKSASSQHLIKVNEPGPQISVEEQNSLVKKVIDRCHPGDWWILAGSLPPGVPSNFYANLIESIQSREGKVLLDTSGQPLFEGCRSLPYLIKPNHIELNELTGLPVETHDQIFFAAQKVQAMGIEIIVVSLGKKGALMVTDPEACFVISPTVQEHNPIGAGDSMTAGLVWSFSRGLPLEEALRWGAACGAATASLDGTAVGSLDLVKQLFSQTTIKRITK